MKKILPAIGVLLIFAGAAFSQQVMTQNWFKAAAAAPAGPSYLGTNNTERGMAYNPVTDHVLLVARKTSPQVIVLDAATGDSVGRLDVTPVAGGTFPLNLIDVTEDGVIYACNLTVNASTTNFTVYRWENETAVPTLAYSDKVVHAGSTTPRYGDAFAVVGSDAGTKIYASGGGGNEWVAIFATADGLIFSWADTVKVGVGNARLGVDATADGNIWGNAFNIRPGLFKTTGDTVGTVSKVAVGDSSYGIKYFKGTDGEDYIAVANRIAAGVPQYARLVKVTGGPDAASLAATTPSLGTNVNLNGTSGLAYDSKRNALIVLITNNGIGSYTIPKPLPVELAAFSAAAIDNRVRLEWVTATETNNFGFEVERSLNGVSFAKIGFVKGNGTSTSPRHYSFVDANLAPGAYYYRLKQIDLDGTTTYSEIRHAAIAVPNTYVLEQNYPNPFNPQATIRYQLAQAGDVSLVIYNPLGQAVLTLVNGRQEAGAHTITVDASSLPSGIYFYKLSVNGFASLKKMVVAK